MVYYLFTDASEEKDDFATKLGTQVVKNLQIHIRNIHIRYEDKVSIKCRGFTLILLEQATAL